MLLWFHLVIPSFPARIDDMRSRFSALSKSAKVKKFSTFSRMRRQKSPLLGQLSSGFLLYCFPWDNLKKIVPTFEISYNEMVFHCTKWL